jgi:hypothetical protein
MPSHREMVYKKSSASNPDLSEQYVTPLNNDNDSNNF